MKTKLKYPISALLLSIVLFSFIPKGPEWILRFDDKKVNYKKIISGVKSNPKASDIYVTNGSIDFFPKEMFELERFRLLLLGNVQLGDQKRFNKDICACEHLLTLQVNSTNLTELNLWDSCKAIYLQHLSITSTKITSLKIRPWNPTLKSLNIFNTELSTLPEKIETIDHLESLSFSKNPNMNVGAELKKITTQKKLKSIGIAYNDLKKFPDEIFALKTLEKIQIHGNDITDFDERLKQLPKLKEINLRQNKTAISEALKTEFKEKLPNCKIQY